MVNFHDPALQATDGCAYGFTAISGIKNILNGFFQVVLLKFWHVVDGLYMWVRSAGLVPTFRYTRISLTQRPPF